MQVLWSNSNKQNCVPQTAGVHLQQLNDTDSNSYQMRADFICVHGGCEPLSLLSAIETLRAISQS